MKILKARRRPADIFCVRYAGDNMKEIRDFTDGRAKATDEGVFLFSDKEPVNPITAGDYIIEAPLGEFHVCKPDEFARTYEEPEEYNPVSIFYEFEKLKQKQLINFMTRIKKRHEADLKANNGKTTLGDYMVVSIFEKVAKNKCSVTGVSKQDEDEDGNGKMWLELTFYYGKNKEKDEDK